MTHNDPKINLLNGGWVGGVGFVPVFNFGSDP